MCVLVQTCVQLTVHVSYVYLCLCICVYVCIAVCMCMSVSVCVRTSVYVCGYPCVCVYVPGCVLAWISVPKRPQCDLCARADIGWPEPYIYAVYGRIFDEIPAKNTVYTPYTYGSGQPNSVGQLVERLAELVHLL